MSLKFMSSNEYLLQRSPGVKWLKALGPILITVIMIIVTYALNLGGRGIPLVIKIPPGLPAVTIDWWTPIPGDLVVRIIFAYFCFMLLVVSTVFEKITSSCCWSRQQRRLFVFLILMLGCDHANRDQCWLCSFWVVFLILLSSSPPCVCPVITRLLFYHQWLSASYRLLRLQRKSHINAATMLNRHKNW